MIILQHYIDDELPFPDSKVHGAHIWDWQNPGEPYVRPMNFAIWFNCFR